MKNYINALLSDISYLKFIKNNKNEWVLDTINEDTYSKRKISLNEQVFFEDNFKVVKQDAGNLNGFSAITYEVTTNNVPGYKMGDTIVAYRGTETKFNDFGTDFIEIVMSLNTIPDAITSVVNKVFGTNFSFSQAEDASLYLKNTSSNGDIYVVGHSLGGFLAMAPTLANPEWINETIR